MTESVIPHLRHALGYTTGVTGGLQVLDPDPGAPAGAAISDSSSGDHETTTTDTAEADALAYAVPHSSTLAIRVQPDDSDRLLELEAFALGEELLHGTRSQFGLARNISLLKQRERNHLFALLRDEIDAATVADEIARCEVTADRIVTKQRRFLEAVDQYLTNTVMDEPGYFDSYAETYAETHDITVADLKSELERHRAALEKTRIHDKEPYQEVYTMLEAIGDKWGDATAQAVADVALDIPYGVEPLALDECVSMEVEEIQLDDRLETARNALEQLSYDPAEVDRNRILTDLQEELEALRGTPAGVNHIHDLDIPLLDVPNQAQETDVRDAIQAAPHPLDRVLNVAFRMEGNFGGVLYITEDGEKMVPRWLMNPLLPADTQFDGQTYQRRTYQQIWETAYFGNRLLIQILRLFRYRFRDKSTGRELPDIDCPFCEISPGLCNGDSCAYQGAIREVNDHKAPLISQLAAHDPADELKQIASDQVVSEYIDEPSETNPGSLAPDE